MDDQKLQMIIDNEREWRKHIINDMDEMKQDIKELKTAQTKFKIKLYAVVAAIGGLAGKGTEYIFKLI